MTRVPRSAALTAALLLPATLAAEHGSPGYTIWPEALTLPTNGRIILSGYNGVPFGLDTLRDMEPRLVAEGQPPIPLKLTHAYDDMEGRDDAPHRRFAEGEGYGESLVIWRPARTLTPGVAYTLERRRAQSNPDDTLRWEAHEPFGGPWTATRPDHTAPAWTGPLSKLPHHPGAPKDYEAGWPSAISLPLGREAAGALLRVSLRSGDRPITMWTYLSPALWDQPDAAYRCANLDHHSRKLAGQPVRLRIRVEDLAGNSTPTRTLLTTWPKDAPGLSFCIPL